MRSIDSPPAPGDFTGRENELAELRAAIEQGGATISGLQGQGGVGKTALALKLAQEIAPQYPDAQIYLDLKGVSEKPLTAAEAMAYVIRAFLPEAKPPESEAELKPIYLSALHGKRALLVLDNARDATQVASLVPPAGSVLIVTSRFNFVVPGLHPKNLDTLPPSDAKALLVRIAPRIGSEADAIAKLCGYLPLALRLAGTALAERVDLSPADYRKRLENERLKALGGVEASIGLSYALLDSDTQKRWRKLAVFPDTFGATAAGAVWKMKLDAAQYVLGRLVQSSLLDWNDATRRYRLHDLVRDFAGSRLQAHEREGAALCHAGHYADALATADVLYRKGGESIKAGLALFDLEWGNIRAGQAWAADHAKEGSDAARLCCDYPGAGVHCLALRQHPRERIRWLEAGLAAARRLKHRAAEGAHLGNLGMCYWQLGQYRRAIKYHEQALDIDREIGSRPGEGNALGNLGNAYLSLGDYHRAIEHYERSLVIAREIGDRKAEGSTLTNLGVAYGSLGDYRRTIEYQEQSLAMKREIGDRRGEGSALGNLGVAYKNLGDYRRAIEYQEQGLAIKREIGDRLGEGNALGNLGLAYYIQGEYGRAIEYFDQRLAVAREIGDQLGEGHALWNKSLALDKLAKRDEAIVRAQEALKILKKIESPACDKVRKKLGEWGEKP